MKENKNLKSLLLPPMDGEVYVNTLEALLTANGISTSDPERGHRMADEAVIDFLEHLGLREFTSLFKTTRKWYG